MYLRDEAFRKLELKSEQLNATEICGVVYETCCAASLVDSFDQYLDFLSSSVLPCCGSPESLESAILDSLWLLDFDNQADADLRNRLARFLSELVSRNLVRPDLTAERLEPELLEQARLISSPVVFTKKQIRINTALLYKQQKYNLLHEESEGYSKLGCVLTEACRPNEELSHSTICQLFSAIEALIGTFDLDPLRVIDIIFDTFIINVSSCPSLFVELMKRFAFPSASLAALIGFKIEFLKGEKRTDEVLDSFCLLIAMLIRIGMISPEEVYSRLEPSDDACIVEVADWDQNVRNAAKKIGVISLSGPSTENSPSDSASIVIEMNTDPALELPKISKNSGNLKVRLIAALLKVDAVDQARLLLDRLSGAERVYWPILKEICHLLHRIVQPCYLLAIDSKIDVGAVKNQSLVEFLFTQRIEADLSSIQEIISEWTDILQFGLFLEPILASKICRIAKWQIQNDKEAKPFWRNVLTKSLLPTLSLSHSNPILSAEIWQLLEFYEYQDRFRMYAAWHANYESVPELLYVRCVVANDAKKILRRLAKENVKLYGRYIGKLCHGNPIIVLPLVLDQLQAYDNFIGPAVDSLKYLTPLSFDVLTWCLLEALANPDRDRLKADGTNISQWLQNLASFTGQLFRKFPTTGNLEAILSYVYCQLNDENSIDLIVLAELIGRLSGLEHIENVSEAQLEAFAGGPLLRADALIGLGHSKGTSSNQKRGISRLAQALNSSLLAVPLWVMIARQPDFILFGSHGIGEGVPSASLTKLLGVLVDQTHDTFHLYSNFMSMLHLVESNLSALPSLSELILNIGIDPPMAFSMHRTVLPLNQINLADGWLETVKSVFPDSAFQFSQPELFAYFWQLKLYDLFVPTTRYEADISRLKAQIDSINASNDTSSKAKRERNRLEHSISSLTQEMVTHSEHVEKIRSLIRDRSKNWFSSDSNDADSLASFVQYCVFPRCIYSPLDAQFTARLIFLMHYVGVPRFSTLCLFDHLFRDISPLLASLTEKEAQHYGRFLAECLAQLLSWHSDSSRYQIEAIGQDRFGLTKQSSTRFLNDFSLVVEPEVELNVDNQINSLSFEDFRHVCYKWHVHLHNALLSCLRSSLFAPIRNTIIVLFRIAPSFPVVRKLAVSLQRAINKIRDRDEREDIKVLATRYLQVLGSGTSRWLDDGQFYAKTDAMDVELDLKEELDGKEEGEMIDETAVVSDAIPVTPADDSIVGSGKESRPPTPKSGEGAREAIPSKRKYEESGPETKRTAPSPRDKRTRETDQKSMNTAPVSRTDNVRRILESNRSPPQQSPRDEGPRSRGFEPSHRSARSREVYPSPDKGHRASVSRQRDIPPMSQIPPSSGNLHPEARRYQIEARQRELERELRERDLARQHEIDLERERAREIERERERDRLAEEDRRRYGSRHHYRR